MDFAAALLEENRLLVELVGGADLDTPVPTCPGWTVRQLVTHVGRGDRWAATIVRDQAQAPVDMRTVADGKPPTDPSEWLTASPRTLLDAVGSVGAGASVWTFTGPRPASWWVRRRLHESSVHRADAATALGAPWTVRPEVAADGVSDWLSLLTARPAAADTAPLAPGTTLHLHATDDGLGAAGEWMVRVEADGALAWEHGHGKGTVAVRGSAADLLLAVLRRIPAEDARLQVHGDAAAFGTWLERTAF
ncbi:MAG: maleylpyruvate isomerase family mycothiol-dependent enzyme [Pseudonocardia sp.]|nr:maleylpyruvate isomerase family mycothiol-dependent enzyme [Pseudonocardia sp.]